MASTTVTDTEVKSFPQAQTHYVVEDLHNIQTFLVTVTLSVSFPKDFTETQSTQCFLCRPMMWSPISSKGQETESCVSIICEFHVICSPVHSSLSTSTETAKPSAMGATATSAVAAQTIYSEIILNDINLALVQCQWDECYGLLDEFNRFVIRIPYMYLYEKQIYQSKYNENLKSIQTQTFKFQQAQSQSAMRDRRDEKDPIEWSMCCRFCGNQIIPVVNVRHFYPLPSGVLDHMMHDFMCCEETPCSPLMTNDLSAQVESLLYHPSYVLTHPLHFKTVSPLPVLFTCKVSPVLLDLYDMNGQAVASTPVLKDSNPFSIRMEQILTQPIVNLDVCTVSCQRCLQYLGEAKLSGDDTAESEVSKTSFNVNDVTGVKWLKSNVHFDVTGDISSLNEEIVGFVDITCEQVLGQCLMYLQASMGHNIHCIYVQDCCSLVLRVTIVNTQYRLAGNYPELFKKSEEEKKNGFREVIKVQYQELQSWEGSTGTECRVPVDFETFQEIKRQLIVRSRLLMPSPASSALPLSWLEK